MAAKKTKGKKGEGYACEVCGFSVIVDEACGCEEEHVFLCCDKPMKKAAAKKAPAKKRAGKK